MNLVPHFCTRTVRRWTPLALVALILTSCMPVAPYTNGEGGPTPPLEDAAPFSNPDTVVLRGTPTPEPDLADDSDLAAATTPVAVATEVTPETVTPDATATSAPTPTVTPVPVTPAVAISMQDALNCLASGQVVYGLALQNTNVRQQTDVAACRIGRIPKGSLVRITGSLDLNNPAANIALVTATPEMTATVAPLAEVTEAGATETVATEITEGAAAISALTTPAPTATPATERVLNAIFPGRSTEVPATNGDSNTVALLPTSTTTATPTSLPTFTPTAAPTLVASAVTEAPHFGYTEDIQPLFDRTCNSCHSGIVKSNDLQVTEYDPLMAGGKSGPAVIPGDAANSLLWTQIESGKMPMVGELSAVDKAMVRDWIDAGAPEFRPTPIATATLVATSTVVATVTPPQLADIETTPDATSSATGTATTTPTNALIVQLPSVEGSANWSFGNQTITATTGAGPQQFAAAGSQWGGWLVVDPADYDAVADSCQDPSVAPLSVVSSELILPVACGLSPSVAALDLLRVSLALPVSTPAVAAVPASSTSAAAAPSSASSTVSADTEDAETAAAADTITGAGADSVEIEAVAAVPAAVGDFSAAAAGISAKAIGLAAAADADGWLTPRGGYCIDRRLPDNDRGITALSFAPDGTLYMALDSKITGEVDPLILNDAFHPSRSIAVYDPVSGNRPTLILDESPRVTGLDYDNGILWVSRAGEVGMIPDGGKYEPLAGGFAVDSQLYHANNGIVSSGGYVYVSAGGVRDGYYEGPIMGISEQGAQDVVSGGNPWAARHCARPDRPIALGAQHQYLHLRRTRCAQSLWNHRRPLGPPVVDGQWRHQCARGRARRRRGRCAQSGIGRRRRGGCALLWLPAGDYGAAALVCEPGGQPHQHRRAHWHYLGNGHHLLCAIWPRSGALSPG